MGNSQQSTTPPDSTLRRVAIVLSSLPPSTASRLLQSMDPKIHAGVQRVVESLAGVDARERAAVLHEFRQQMFAVPSTAANTNVNGQDTDEYQDKFDVRRENHVLPSGSTDLLNSQVASVVSQWELPRSFDSQSRHASPFAFLDDVDDETFVKLLSGEHAQTIALVFASITPKQAARILPRLDLGVQSETVRRIGRLEDVPEATVTEVAAHLRERARDLEQSRSNPGHQTLKAIIDAMPHGLDEQPQIHEKMSYHDEITETDDAASSTAETIPIGVKETTEEALSTEDVHLHLIQLPPRALCLALGRVETRQALLTLCGLPNGIAETALSMLSRSRAKEVRRGMANLTSVKLREIDKAKEAVALASLEMDHRQLGNAA